MAIRKANLPEVIRLIDRFFSQPSLSQPTEAVPHIALNPTHPEPGQPENLPVAVAPGIAHTLATPPAEPASASPPTSYSLTSLFADEQHRILRTILNRTVGEMEDSLRKIYEDHASLLHFLTESGMNPPPALALAASFAINGEPAPRDRVRPLRRRHDRRPAAARRQRSRHARRAPSSRSRPGSA